ncbi:MAG TPA: triose-phosphate isomerase [Parcubacteria group bacterium]|nr:triose-phosphate isomerase [Parcubacteria group bacterium]
MKYILAANWKSHPSNADEAKKLLVGLVKNGANFKKLHTIIAPPNTFLELVNSKIRSIGVLASQDMSLLPKGTYTGETTAEMLKGLGVRVSIVGHSERRKLGETNTLVAAKVSQAIKEGIVPIVCVGEDVHDTEGGYYEVLNSQIRNSLEGLKKTDVKKLVVAYEPLWAIGKSAKDAMQPGDLGQMVVYIRKVLTEMYGRTAADQVTIIYGGSVEPGNAKELLSSGAQGFLVGHASLNSKSFAEIAKAILNK